MRSLESSFDRYRRLGDPAALARVFDRTARGLLLLASHLARDPSEAEDLLQATFVTAIERASSWDRSRPLLPWLSGILAHHAANAARRRRARQDPVALESAPAPLREPHEELGHGELRASLERALATLGPPYREVLEAHLLLGHRPEEIAADLGRAPGTVRAQLHRGLDRLRRRLPRGLAAADPIAWPLGLDELRRRVLEQAAASPRVAPPLTLPTLLSSLGLLPLSLAAAFLVGALALLALHRSPDDLAERLSPRPPAHLATVAPPPALPPPPVDSPRDAGLRRELDLTSFASTGGAVGPWVLLADHPLYLGGSAEFELEDLRPSLARARRIQRSLRVELRPAAVVRGEVIFLEGPPEPLASADPGAVALASGRPGSFLAYPSQRVALALPGAGRPVAEADLSPGGGWSAFELRPLPGPPPGAPDRPPGNGPPPDHHPRRLRRGPAPVPTPAPGVPPGLARKRPVAFPQP